MLWVHVSGCRIKVTIFLVSAARLLRMDGRMDCFRHREEHIFAFMVFEIFAETPKETILRINPMPDKQKMPLPKGL